MISLFQPRVLTRGRVRLAYAIAITADAVQLALGPLGWLMADEVLDVAAMIAISSVIGFHPVLLPTFAVELLPVIDLLPTWTGSVALVVALRKKRPVTTPDVAADRVVIDVPVDGKNPS
jgi:hypothetical protein